MKLINQKHLLLRTVESELKHHIKFFNKLLTKDPICHTHMDLNAEQSAVKYKSHRWTPHNISFGFVLFCHIAPEKTLKTHLLPDLSITVPLGLLPASSAPLTIFSSG